MSLNRSAPERILLLGHGSRRSRTTATETGILEIARRLQQRFPAGPEIRPAFFEFLSPSLAEAVEQAATDGVRRLAVLPYFLFAGKEIQLEIPEALDMLRTEFPSLSLAQLPHLGVDRRMAELAALRVRQALWGTSQYLPAHGLVRRGATGRLGAILVSRGSRAEWDSGADLRSMAEMTARALGEGALVTTAQAENSERTIEVAADELAASAVRRVVVIPYLHFIGKVLVHNVVPALERARAAHPGIQFCLAWTLCVNDPALDMLADRVRSTGFA